MPGYSMRFLLALVASLMISLTATNTAHAERYPIAVFSGLDKVSADVTQFEAPLNKPVRYGSLEVVVYACHKKPPEELPQTSVYLEVRQVSIETQQVDPAPIFKGWMFAESPGLNGLEHPVYDIWPNTCKGAAKSDSGNL